MKDSCARHAVLLLFSIATLCSCKKEEVLGPPIERVSEITPKDIANKGDASDIEVFFRKQIETENILEYRILAIKANSAGSFSDEDAESLPTENYAQTLPSEIYPVKGLRLTSSSKDTDGDVIVEDVPYRFAVFTISKNLTTFSNALEIDDSDFVLSTNNLIFDHTQELSIGSNSMTIDDEGHLYMGDFNIHAQLGSTDSPLDYAIHKILPSGSVEVISPSYKLLSGNTLDNNLNLYQSVLFSGEVIKIDPDGISSTISFPTLLQPDGIHVAADGNVFIVDLAADAIFQVSPDGSGRSFAKVPENPRGITADDDGNLYVSHNSEAGIISKISPEGDVSVFANVPATKPLNYVLDYIMWVGYIVYHEDFLYVAVPTEDQIFKISLAGDVSIFAGSGKRGIPKGGALTADLNRPLGLAFSKDGSRLFVSGCTDIVPQHTQYSAPAKIWEILLVE